MVRSLRNSKGLTQRSLAQRAGIANTTLCDIEAERSQPSIKVLEAIVGGCGVTLAEFFASEGPRRTAASA